MVWYIITLVFSTMLDLISISRQSTVEKNLEILVLRQQLAILQRKHTLRDSDSILWIEFRRTCGSPFDLVADIKITPLSG